MGAKRTVETRDAEGNWRETPWSALKEGMVFRVRNADGEINNVEKDEGLCVAAGDAFDDGQMWGVAVTSLEVWTRMQVAKALRGAG